MLYSPSMASTAIAPARLLGQGKGVGDFAEHEVPSRLICLQLRQSAIGRPTLAPLSSGAQLL